MLARKIKQNVLLPLINKHVFFLMTKSYSCINDMNFQKKKKNVVSS